MKKLGCLVIVFAILVLAGCVGPHTDPEPDTAIGGGEGATVLTPGCTNETPAEKQFITPIAVYIGGEVIEPYVHFGSATIWDAQQEAWLCADGLSLENVFPDIAAEIPSFTYSEDYALDFMDNVSFAGGAAYQVYTTDFELLRLYLPMDDLTDLPEGSHYLVLRVQEQGDYITEGEGCEVRDYYCVFLANK